MDNTDYPSEVLTRTKLPESLVNTSEMKDNVTLNYTGTVVPSDDYSDIILSASIIILIFAILAILINLLLLLASKFTTAGRDSILVFIRSLCVADTLVGIYGVSKFAFVSHRPQWVNCFLPDALLICAFTAGNFTLIGLLADCCTSIMYYLHKNGKQHYSKYKTIFLMIYLWNAAFILAFLPQMGWNHEPYACAFFQYHSVYYLTFISILFFISVLLMTVYCIKGSRMLRKLQKEINNPPHVKIALVKIQATVRTSHFDVVAQIVSYLPLVIYILLHCHSCVNANADYADAYLFLLMPIIILKSIITGIIHGKRTSQISQVICKHWTLVYSAFKKKTKDTMSSDVFHIESNEPDIDLSTEQTSASDQRESIQSDSLYKYVLKKNMSSRYGGVSSYNSKKRRSHSVAVESGLLNVASLTTMTPVPRIKDCFVCSHCGHFNPVSAIQTNKAASQPTQGKASSHMYHPLQVVYSGKHWKNIAKNNQKQLAANSSHSSHAYDNKSFEHEDDVKNIKKSQKRRYSTLEMPKVLHDSFPLSVKNSEAMDSMITENHPSNSGLKNKSKNRSHSLDSALSFSKELQSELILTKTNKYPHLQKFVKFRDTLNTDTGDIDEVFSDNLNSEVQLNLKTDKAKNGIAMQATESVTYQTEGIIHRKRHSSSVPIVGKPEDILEKSNNNDNRQIVKLRL